MLVGASNHLHRKGERLVTQEVVTGYMSNSFALVNTKTKLGTLNGSCLTQKHHA
jgi:hypothetical protein